MIKVSHLSKSFGLVKAVDDLSFEIDKGQIVGFLGPNGAGKTTTMRLLTGFLAKDSGEITIDNLEIGKDDLEIQKKIGYLPENNPLYKEMLVSETLNLAAELKGIFRKKKKEAFDFVVSASNIDEVFYRPIHELSKGFKQRVGMAMALLGEPEILIMDEPSEGLDPNQRNEIRHLIKKLSKERTIILSTHVMQEASAVCNRILIMNKGKLIADGSKEELTSLSHKELVINLDLEGKDLKSSFLRLPGIKKLDFTEKGPDRFQIILNLEKDTVFQPLFSKLAHEKNWTIWELIEKKQDLEDIFGELTKE